MKPHRREFLQNLAAGTAALSLPRALWGQKSLAAAKLTDKITLITGAGNNIVALAGDGGSLLVDCGDAAHAQEVLGLGRGRQEGDQHALASGIDRCERRDGEGRGEACLHVNTELWMTQEIIHDWEKKVFPPRAKEALPTETFYTTGKTTFGGEAVEYGLMPMAHTDGDIYVYFPQSNVLVAGDAVQPGRLPLLDWPTGGWIGGMQEAQRTLLASGERLDEDCACQRGGDEQGRTAGEPRSADQSPRATGEAGEARNGSAGLDRRQSHAGI